MIEINCEECNKIVTKRPFDLKRNKHHFCSVSCSNRFNPKRKPEGNCKDCGNLLTTSRTYCKNCVTSHYGLIDTLTLQEASYGDKSYNRYTRVRVRAQAIYKNLRTPCLICKYSKHTEICHKKAISDFSMDTLVKEVNDRLNIVFLCRNCHWEFDHGILILPVDVAGTAPA